MQSDELIIINRIQKTLKERYHNIGESMMSGTVDNMEKYKYMLGQAHTCLTIFVFYLLVLVRLIAFLPFLKIAATFDLPITLARCSPPVRI